jgi:hypothetical protein
MENQANSIGDRIFVSEIDNIPNKSLIDSALNLPSFFEKEKYESKSRYNR